LSVRETERALKKRKHRANDAPKAVVTPKDANMRLAETKLMRSFGTNVKISPSGNKGAGKIEIEYYNADDLDRIFERLMKDIDAADA
jgi:ParB family chromosome partitioning protein